MYPGRNPYRKRMLKTALGLCKGRSGIPQQTLTLATVLITSALLARLLPSARESICPMHHRNPAEKVLQDTPRRHRVQHAHDYSPRHRRTRHDFHDQEELLRKEAAYPGARTATGDIRKVESKIA